MGKVVQSTGSATATLRRIAVPPWPAIEPHLHRVSALPDERTRDDVARILAAVREHGDSAVRRFQQELDGATLAPEEWEVPSEAWQEALRRLAPGLRAALERAAGRIRSYHERQRESGFMDLCADGTRLGYRVQPLDRVGVYVPGGQAAYPSSVLMSVIPAGVAGVREIVVVTPGRGAGRQRGREAEEAERQRGREAGEADRGRRDSSLPADAVLAACAIAGVTRLFRVGGAQAIGALAFGTETIPRVDKIVGPGNRWVAEAKRQAVGVVGIDMIAGPTEVVIIADDSAPPAYVAADLLAQAEHDADASAWLITTSAALADAVDDELAIRVAALPRREIASQSLARNGLAVVVPDLETAIEVCNRRAPEHVELLVRDAGAAGDRIINAGAVFVGADTPEPVGDYLAGPSHVLPTGGTARFASPLGVYDFIKRMSIIAYSQARLAADALSIVALAEAEGLDGHAEAVRVRREKGEGGREKREGGRGKGEMGGERRGEVG